MTLIQWFTTLLIVLSIICAFGIIYMIGGYFTLAIAICFAWFAFAFTKSDRK